MLRIIKASAGSGKTHTLVNHYLSLALEKDFRTILAVTFTNNAAFEMKYRIISTLRSLSSENPKAFEILRNIIHNYNDFRICTIDSFVANVVRAFVFELKLANNFEIELDNDFVLAYTIDKLLAKIQNNGDLHRYLREYIFEKLQNNESWYIKNSLRDFSALLFKERVNELFAFYNVDKNDFELKFNILKENFYAASKKYKKIIEETVEFAQNYADKVKNHHLKRKLSSYAEKKDIRDFLEGQSIKKLSEKFNDDIEREVFNKVVRPLQDLINDKNFLIIERFKRNFYNFGLLNKIYLALRQYCDENNVLFINDLIILLKKLNENLDVPFIYEKIGTNLNYILIDEFQDTSSFQWYNLEPLIEHTLSLQNVDKKNQHNLIVGDTKQAIYRWRNGDWQLFEFIIPKKYQKWSILETLSTNYRSLSNIVKFNNVLFSPNLLPEILQRTLEVTNSIKISELYKDSFQNLPDRCEGGYIQLDFYNNIIDGYQEAWFVDLIYKLLGLSSGKQFFYPDQICVLTRTNSEAQTIVELLLNINNELPKDKRFNVLSMESLEIENAKSVRLLVDAMFLSAFLNTSNKQEDFYHYWFSIIVFYLSINKQNIDYVQISNDIVNGQIDKYFNFEIQHFLKEIFYLPVNLIVQLLIDKLNIKAFSSEISFIRTFLEIVENFSHKKSNNLIEFLYYWKLRGFKSIVKLPNIKNTIQVMTIHKAKGLAFDVVIMPFTNWSIKPKYNNQFIWVETKESIFKDIFQYLPVRVSSKFDFKEDYEEHLFTLVDNLNLLYVAFTRPRLALFSLSKINNSENVSNVGNALFQAMELIKNNGLLDIQKTNLDNLRTTYSIGELKPMLHKNESNSNIFTLPYLIAEDWRKKIVLSIEEEDSFNIQNVKEVYFSRKIGLIVHKILEISETADDLLNNFEKIKSQYYLSETEIQKIEDFLLNVKNNEVFNEIFKNAQKIYVEKEILTADGNVFRPDKVVVKENEIIVLDYKTGGYKYADRKQIKEYKQMLQKIYKHSTVKSYIFYISENKIISVD